MVGEKSITKEKIESFKNYIHIFNLAGLRVLINDIFIRVYPDYGFLILIKNGDYHALISPEGLERCRKEGGDLFENLSSFERYIKEIKDFIETYNSFRQEFNKKDEYSREDLEKFFNYCIQTLNFYKYTDHNFSEGAYERAKELNDKDVFERLEEFGRFKLEMRGFINQIFVDPQSDLEILLKKISLTFDIKISSLKEYRYEEIVNLVEGGGKTPEDLIDKRSMASTLYNDNGVVKYLWGEEARGVFDTLVIQENSEIKTLKGVIASKGVVKGTARVIYADYDDITKLSKLFEEMQEGEILISETTSPDLMPACKKASAIVTNQGGMISHAAIVSREMGIPCIVGVKDATKIIKNGDLIEVDANTGVVKIIN